MSREHGTRDTRLMHLGPGHGNIGSSTHPDIRTSAHPREEATGEVSTTRT